MQICIPYQFCFPLGEDGHAMVTSTTLSLRFQFREDTLYVEEEVFDDVTGELSHSVGQLSRKNDMGTFWLLNPGKYRVYGVSESVLDGSTKLLTPRESSIKETYVSLVSHQRDLCMEHLI